MARLTRTGLCVNRYCSMAVFPFRHLGFLKGEKFQLPVRFGGPNLHHNTKFGKDRLNRSGDMADFDFSTWRPSAILNFQKLEIFNFRSRPFGGPICVIVPNFAKIGRSVPEILPIFDFSRWRPPPSWILEMSNFWRLGRSRGSKCVCVPNFCCNRWNRG